MGRKKNQNTETTENVFDESINPTDNQASKALIANSRVWLTQKSAGDNKYFEKHFYIGENEELTLGTKLFNDPELQQPLEGVFGWITIGATADENQPQWHVARIDESGEILELIAQ